MGKNKIRKLENLNLPNLEILSIQSNRITHLENLDQLVNLKELYLSDNGLTKIEGLDALINLKVLDFSNNQIERIENISSLVKFFVEFVIIYTCLLYFNLLSFTKF